MVVLVDFGSNVSEEEDVFELGGDTYMEERPGISGEVSTVPIVGIRYPHILVTSIEGMTRSALSVVADSLTAGARIPGKAYPVYCNIDGELFELGECHPQQVKLLIRTFTLDKLKANITKERSITGNLLYAMSD